MKITNNKENETQNNNEVLHPHIIMATIKKKKQQKVTSVGRIVEKLESLSTNVWIAKWCHSHEK